MTVWFRKLKITHKLTATAVILIAGFLALGAVYLFQVQSGHTLAAETEQAEQLVAAADELRADIAEARRNADRFFGKGGGLAELEAFKLAMARIAEEADSLKSLLSIGTEAEDTALANRLDEALNAFTQAFEQATSAKVDLGIDHDAGMRGAAREAIQQLETALSSAIEAQPQTEFGGAVQNRLALEQLRSSMLMMRRHEKDYIEREDDTYVNNLAEERVNFQNLLTTTTLTEDQSNLFSGALDDYFGSLLGIVEATKRFNELRDQFSEKERALAELSREVVEEELTDQEILRADSALQQNLTNAIFGGVLAGVAAIALLSIVLLAQGMIRSLRRLNGAVREVAQGNLEARAQMPGGDELAQLGNAFDRMLDERVADLARQARENEQLNDSVINIMDAADRLSKRDLTVVVPVSEDITGTVSDALNLMARQTAHTMTEINTVAQQLEQVANAVRMQGDKVSDVAASERDVVAQALKSLEQSAATMAEIAQIALNTNELATNASGSSKKALGAVRTTVQSMGEIRNSVGEAEKSIKRLGERSQEIGAIVEIIKDIAERTHTLALNAGMQAVAAGEAGRGFSVVADEVQRLAETARESTNQITTLVRSIQAESSESMATMNKTIGQVVQGSELAERAGKRMRLTQKVTEDLVGSVAQIAERAKLLESTNQELRDQASALQQSTEATEQELQAQAEQTRTMFQFLQNLVQSVRVFKLPDAA